MKKLLSVFMTAVLCLGMVVFSGKAEAATLDSTAGIVHTTTGRLNIRSSSSTKSTVLTSVSKGSYLTLLSQSGSWWRVEYAKGKYGYAHADYIRQASGTAASVRVQSGNLNVRSGGGISYAIQARLPHGENVIILSEANGWSKVLYHGNKIGYVSSNYLLKRQAYPAISLSMPSLKQNDSRWANVLIGSSGKTIGQIGCTTTAIAMIESYRTGKTIYPDAMSKKLSYSSSGDLYWPSDYQVVLSNTDYLAKMYEQLKLGKPILFGAKTTAGRQHWVVVNGYTGGDQLTASGFTILDPGSNTRVNLQQYLNAYPVFYKYFYYK